MSGPFASPNAVTVSVPVSMPRYEFKTRLNRALTVTDSMSEDNGRSPADYLTARAHEALYVRQGPATHQESIEYRAFACYKHGTRQVHTQSVGYSSDGDLVLMRREVATSDREGSDCNRRRALAVDSALCLNPKAKPVGVKIDPDADMSRWGEARLNKLRKYPGVRCPKNRKTRNRLINDHFATASARVLYKAAESDSDPDGLRKPAEPAFAPIPDSVQWLVDSTEATQAYEMRRLGLDSQTFAGCGARQAKVPPRSPESAHFRFLQLPSRLKSEVQHAMTTDFMPGFIADLEDRFEVLLDAARANPAVPHAIQVACKDGYGRLITHAVAAFYKLASKSAPGNGETRVTTVTVPKKVPLAPEQRLGSFLRGERAPTTSEGTTPTEAMPSESKAAFVGKSSDYVAQSSDSERDECTEMRRKRFRKRCVIRRSAPTADGL